MRWITLQVRQDLKGRGLRERLQELLRQLAVRRDQQRRDFRFVCWDICALFFLLLFGVILAAWRSGMSFGSRRFRKSLGM